MNLPQLTAQIGKAHRQGTGGNELESLLRRPKMKLREGDEPYAVYLTFDIGSRLIQFDMPAQRLTSDLLHKVNYLGNNSAAAAQAYVVRESESLYYLFTSVWNDLSVSLVQYGMAESELAVILAQMEEVGLITRTGKKGGGSLVLDRLALPIPSTHIEINKAKKSMLVGEQLLKYETFVKMCIEDDGQQNRIVLIIPRIKQEDGTIVVLSMHADYITLVKKLNNLTDEGTVAKSPGGEGRMCYVCHQVRQDVFSEYTKKFSRSGVNKIFITQKVNTAPLFDRKRYDDSYSICLGCYQDMLAGEKAIEERYRSRIAGEQVFILPESLLNEFDYNVMNKLKQQVDLAFQAGNMYEFTGEVQAQAEFELPSPFYMLNFLIYRTDGTSVTVLDTIEDVPALRFIQVQELFTEEMHKLQPHLTSISLASVYRMIPVRESEKGQVDVQRVLGVYKSLLSGHLLDLSVLHQYAAEALDKGIKQLNKSKADNFHNMDLKSFVRENGDDWFIKQTIMRYLVLLQVCSKLGIISKKQLIKGGSGKVVNIAEVVEKSRLSLEKMELFLEQQQFSEEAKGLFYLGTMLQCMAFIQVRKGHKSKPILRKVNFQGMKQHELLRLYHDLWEKFRQYDKLTAFHESLMHMFNQHYGSPSVDKQCTELENVFYLMAGYAYMVGQREPEATKSELVDISEEEKEDVIE